MTILESKGWNVSLYARRKCDVFELMRCYGLPFYDAGLERNGLAKLAGFLPRSLEIYRIARKTGVDVLAGISPVHAALASRVLGLPSIGFTDTEHALEQIAIFAPNCSSIYTPHAFKRNLGKKHHRYPGYHELSYLHPNYFKPDKSSLEENGLLDQGPPIVLRFIKWDATHDFGVKHRAMDLKLVDYLAKQGNLVISVEGTVPKHIKKYANPLPVEQFHNLLAYSKMYIGPGATSASESALLGTPAIYTNTLQLGYISELEYRYGLVHHRTEYSDIVKTINQILERKSSAYDHSRKQLLRETCDVASFIAEVIIEHV